MRLRLSDFVPPILLRWLFSRPDSYGFFGDYPDWASAAAASRPYDLDIEVTARLLDETRQGRREPGLNAAVVLAALLAHGGNANVLDFGGGLGVGYFRLSSVVPHAIASWRVIEKAHVVEHGARHFAADKLSFWRSLPEATEGWRPDIVIASSVLEYLPDRYDLLRQLVGLNPDKIVIDRSPIGDEERIMIQRVPSQNCGYVVPCAVLSRSKLEAALRGYDLFFEQTLGPFHHTVPSAQHKSIIFSRRQDKFPAEIGPRR
jgi:putative methyltransferase (TIGR04325 family)